MTEYFKYELTPYPMSLFKDGILRKPDKAALRNSLLTKEVTQISSPVKVLDGGALLHQVYWPKNFTYKDLFHH